ncbi:MAG: hypothetical protein WAT79_05575 [Saprospiraceae bacterium]
MKVKILIFLLILINFGIISCKGKPESNEQVGNNQPKGGIAAADHSHAHYYRVYKGKLKKSPLPNGNSFYEKCIFKKTNNTQLESYYILNSPTANDIEKGDFSYYYVRFDSSDNNRYIKDKTFLLKKNESISPNYHLGEKEEHKFMAPAAKGNLGCFPGFILVSGNLDYFEDGGSRYIQIPLAYHNPHTKTIETLYTLDFNISTTTYDSINAELQNEPNLHGGVDTSGTIKTLNIYDPNDNLWSSFREGM